nr:Dihydrofolate reductase [uncultured bacterium]AIA16317.1 Dihydrofolate reductase [uncultured bacterium]
MIDLVVARAHNGVIGSKNALPWYLSADLKHFKELTTGGTVIMGRNTYQSIVDRLHGPLPGRRNIIISSTLTEVDGFEVYPHVDMALAATKPDEAVHIIGGAVLYEACLEQRLVDRIYLTEVDADIPGDTFFPELQRAEWQETAREAHQADAKNPYDYSFVTLERIRSA